MKHLHRNGDLFVNQLKYVRDHHALVVAENFFSASFVGALRESPAFTRAFLTILNGDSRMWGGRAIAKASIAVDFQPSFRINSPGRRLVRPDLVLIVNDRYRVGIEVKLGSPEGVDSTGRLQLVRYLECVPDHLTHLAFITGYHSFVAPEVRRARPYLLHSSSRSHFLWSDFYYLIRDRAAARDSSGLLRALFGLMNALHFEPVHPLVGDLGGRLAHNQVSKEARERRAWMRDRWRPTIQEFESRGFLGERVRNNAEFYKHPNPALKWEINVSPRALPGALRICLKMRGRAGRRNRDRVLQALESTGAWPKGTSFGIPGAFLHPTIDARIPWQTLLRGATTDAAVEARLKSAVFNIVDIASDLLGGPTSS